METNLQRELAAIAANYNLLRDRLRRAHAALRDAAPSGAFHMVPTSTRDALLAEADTDDAPMLPIKVPAEPYVAEWLHGGCAVCGKPNGSSHPFGHLDCLVAISETERKRFIGILDHAKENPDSPLAQPGKRS